MAIRDIVKLSRKTFFNPLGWIDLASLKTQTRSIWDIVSGLFESSRPEREETFEAAQARLMLTDNDVINTAKTYKLYALIFTGLGFLVFMYAFFLLFRYFTITGWLLALAAASLFFAQAFRFDFWALQMKTRRLGLTFKEWKSHVLGIKGQSK